MIINVIQIDDPKVDVTFVRFHEWESVQFEQRGQLLRGLCIVKTETWYGQLGMVKERTMTPSGKCSDDSHVISVEG